MQRPQRPAARHGQLKPLITLAALLVLAFAARKGETADSLDADACAKLGFAQPNCEDCEALLALTHDKDLASECRQCCEAAGGNEKYVSAVLEVDTVTG